MTILSEPIITPKILMTWTKHFLKEGGVYKLRWQDKVGRVPVVLEMSTSARLITYFGNFIFSILVI